MAHRVVNRQPMFLDYFCSSKRSSKQAELELFFTFTLQNFTHNMAEATLNIDSTQQ